MKDSLDPSFGGSVMVTDPLPPSGCRDSYTAVCVTDAQIRSQLNDFRQHLDLLRSDLT